MKKNDIDNLVTQAKELQKLRLEKNETKRRELSEICVTLAAECEKQEATIPDAINWYITAVQTAIDAKVALTSLVELLSRYHNKTIKSSSKESDEHYIDKGRILKMLAQVLEEQKNWMTAAECYKELGEKEEILRVFSLLGEGQFELAKSLNDPEQQQKAYLSAASSFLAAGDYNNLFKMYSYENNKFAWLSDEDHPIIKIKILQAIGIYYTEVKQYTNALEMYQKAGALCLNRGERSYALSLISLVRDMLHRKNEQPSILDFISSLSKSTISLNVKANLLIKALHQKFPPPIAPKPSLLRK